jgi:hypothetical protein
MMTDGPEWFAPKRFGVGAVRPTAWQGWVATGLFVGAVAASSLLLRHHQVAAFVSVIVSATAVFTVVAARTTKGGWHWRWGGKS